MRVAARARSSGRALSSGGVPLGPALRSLGMLGKRQADFLTDALLHGGVWWEGCGHGGRNVDAIKHARRLEALGLLQRKTLQSRLEWHVTDPDSAWAALTHAGLEPDFRDRVRRIEEMQRRARKQ